MIRSRICDSSFTLWLQRKKSVCCFNSQSFCVRLCDASETFQLTWFLETWQREFSFKLLIATKKNYPGNLSCFFMGNFMSMTPNIVVSFCQKVIVSKAITHLYLRMTRRQHMWLRSRWFVWRLHIVQESEAWNRYDRTTNFHTSIFSFYEPSQLFENQYWKLSKAELAFPILYPISFSFLAKMDTMESSKVKEETVFKNPPHHKQCDYQLEMVTNSLIVKVRLFYADGQIERI